MAVTSTRRILIEFASDLVAALSFAASSNAAAPGDIDVLTLATGFNTIPLPGGGTTVRAATIIPPAANTQTITLKGVTGDTGIAISPTEPTSIAFHSTPPASFGLTVSGDIAGVRIIWT